MPPCLGSEATAYFLTSFSQKSLVQSHNMHMQMPKNMRNA